jgi:hypothetical protein
LVDGQWCARQAVQFAYISGDDTFTLTFIKSLNVVKNKKIEQVYTEDVIKLIETYTGFSLRL